MASTYSTNLAIELIGTGDQAGTWGNTTNTNLGTLIEQAISGYVTQAVSTGTDTTITIPNGATGVARNMYIELTGTGGTNTNLIVPANKKLYFIFNNASGAVTVKVSGQTGVSVPAGKKVVLASNGTDTVNALNYIADFGSNSATITQLTATSATITNLTLTSLVISNLSIASANVTVLTSASATITNLLATSLTVSSGSTLNGGVVINEPGADVDFRVEGDTDANLFFADASTDRIGIGTSSPAYKLDVSGTLRATGDSVIGAPSGGFAARLQLGQSSANTEVCLLSLQNTATETATTGARIDFGGASNWLGRISTRFVGSTGGGNSTLSLYTASGGTIYERLLIDQNGNLGLGVTPSAWVTYKAFQTTGSASFSASPAGAGTAFLTHNGYYDGSNWKYLDTTLASQYRQTLGVHSWFTAASGTAGNTISFTQAMTLDSGGSLGIGTTSPSSIIHATKASGNATYLQLAQTGVESWQIGMAASSSAFAFLNSGTERARITSGGILLVGKTASTFSVAGVYIGGTGQIQATVSQDDILSVNRSGNDGNLVRFFQDQTEEGNISVSGNTVSYNAFAGSHWSQLQDGSKPDILRGTVMESINELCVWPDENNERLPKSKISDTAGSKKVYGVFMAWDNDWTTTNDMYVTAVGAFICRVNGSVTVQEGDLLESNGDGTARVQADDIIRSSTIGKVTSTVKTHEYDDGSYCVPTVLYCG